MTYKDALDFLKNEIAIDLRLASDETFVKTKGSLKLAIVALEKQIPKKPDEYGEDWFFCPTCETDIISLDELETHKFCLVCGQALDWSGTE